MAIRLCTSTLCAATTFLVLQGCSTSPFDAPTSSTSSLHRLTMPSDSIVRNSAYRTSEASTQNPVIAIDATPESYVRYALFHSPAVERAYQQWRIAAERVPQVKALPDPRFNIGFFLNEVESRVGPQQARVGLQQTFPWIGKLQDREDAAAKGALAAWYQYQDAQLRISEQVMVALYNLSYLDEAINITQDNYTLLQSFAEVVVARYRLGSGSHPELIRVQTELGQLQDRVIQLKSSRPAYVAALNALLNRHPESEIPTIAMPNWVASDDANQLSQLAHQWSPVLQSITHRVEQARIGTEIARKDGYPDLTIGIDYIVTDEAAITTMPESGDDPIMLSFGMNLPIWREKYDAKVRESISRRLMISREFDTQTNTISAQIYQAWFEHTDAARRVRLYEQSLIPKAQESLSASLAGFRSGNSEFLDLIDTERTLLEFSIMAQRAKADRGKALAKLNRLVGKAIPTQTAPNTSEPQP